MTVFTFKAPALALGYLALYPWPSREYLFVFVAHLLFEVREMLLRLANRICCLWLLKEPHTPMNVPGFFQMNLTCCVK